MTPLEVFAVLDVGIRGTELPPTLEAAHAQFRDLRRALNRMDIGGVWLTPEGIVRLIGWYDWATTMHSPMTYQQHNLDLLRKLESS